MVVRVRAPRTVAAPPDDPHAATEPLALLRRGGP
jgi:hypothetical protein